MNKKILHICESSAFLISTIENFEKCLPSGNLFLVNANVVIHSDSDLTGYSNVVFVDYNSEEFKKYLADYKKYFLVILHNIGVGLKNTAVNIIDGHLPMHGILWGWEIYDTEKLNNFFCLKKTREYIKRYKKKKYLSIEQRTMHLFRSFTKPNAYWNKNWKIFEKLNSYSTILRTEKDFIESYYGIKKMYFPFNYAGIYSLKDLDIIRSGNNVLIGNSATTANNHLDVLAMLGKLNKNISGKIIIPLSYGNVQYAEYIERRYREVFDDKVMVLRDFLPLDDYNILLTSCGFVIMNQIRQQAMGNIYLSLLQGAKVFFNKRSFAYKELSSHDVKVYTLEDFDKEYPNPENPGIVKRNRKIIHALRGPEATKKYIKNIIDYYQQ